VLYSKYAATVRIVQSFGSRFLRRVGLQGSFFRGLSNERVSASRGAKDSTRIKR